MTASIVTLRVFLFGLLFFDTSSDQCQPMRVLMLDARHPPNASDGCPVEPHSPVLLYENGDAECADPCRVDHGFCRCDLDRQQVNLDPQDWAKKNPACAGGKCCDNVDKYAVKMFRLRRGLDRWLHLTKNTREKCGGRGSQKKCPLVIADAVLSPSEIVACDMAVDPDDPTQLQHYEFKPLTEGRLFNHEQTLASIIMATEKIRVELPPGKAVPESVQLPLMAYTEHEEYTVDIPVQLCTSGGESQDRCADVVLANFTDDSHAPADERCASSDLDRHFEMFHDLVGKPIGLPSRPVPQLGPKHSPVKAPTEKCQLSSLYQKFAATVLRNGLHSQICPMAAQ